jgi:hypothetical protein
MPHLPTTWKERKEADLERKVERTQTDQRFQWLRTRGVRRAVVILGGLLLCALVPGYAQGGSLVGTCILIATWVCWLALRVSVRTVADLPDRFLDERQRVLRDRAYLVAFRIYAWIVGALATAGLIAFSILQENDQVTLTTTWQQAFGLGIFVITLPILLPSMVVAWRDLGEARD